MQFQFEIPDEHGRHGQVVLPVINKFKVWILGDSILLIAPWRLRWELEQ